MPFKWTLMSDVSQVIKGTADVEQAIGDVADTLDALGKETGDTADKAAGQLERKFKDAFDAVQSESKETGRKLGTDVDDGARKAGEGIDNFKDEGKQSIRETAASFSDVTDALDLVQEVAANAFVGFGPAGMAAGALAAIGIGALKASLDDAKEKADTYVETVHTMATALQEVGGVADSIADSMTDIVDTKEWWELWQSLPMDRLTMWAQATRDWGMTWSDVYGAASGDLDAFTRLQQQAAKTQTDTNMDAQTAFLTDLRTRGEALAAAKQWNEDYANSTVAAHKRAEEAQVEAARQAQETTKAFAESLTDHLSVADEGLDRFVYNGKTSLDKWRQGLKDSVQHGTLQLKEWTEELRRRAREAKTVDTFAVTIAPKLSPEALANFEKLSTDTQLQIAKAFKSGKAKDRKQIIANLEAEAKVKTVKVDTSEAQVSADTSPVEVPATVDATGLPKDVRAAADSAQREANKDTNKIEIKTKIDADELQRQVNRAAASITPPTITVRTKVAKEVP